MIKLGLTFILSFVLNAFAQTSSGSYNETKVFSGSESTITAHGTCKRVTFSGSGALFVPSRSAEEWNSFLSAPIPGVSKADCGTLSNCYTDSDGDGYGAGGVVSTTYSTCPSGQSLNNTDCNDSNASFTTVCSTVTCYLDGDGDGYGAGAGTTVSGTTCPSGRVTDNTDCNDSAYSTTNTCSTNTDWQCTMGTFVNTGTSCGTASIMCSATNDFSEGTTFCCGGLPSGNCVPPASVTCYRDADGDGYGNSSSPQSFSGSCGSGYVTDNTDCDDTTYSSSNSCGPSSGCGSGWDYCCMEAQQCCKPSSSTPNGFSCVAGDPMVPGTDMGNGSYGYLEAQCTYGYRVAGGSCLTAAP